MKKHSTKIFQDIVNGLGAFIQSQFVSQQSTQPQQTGNTRTKVSEDLIIATDEVKFRNEINVPLFSRSFLWTVKVAKFSTMSH